MSFQRRFPFFFFPLPRLSLKLSPSLLTCPLSSKVERGEISFLPLPPSGLGDTRIPFLPPEFFAVSCYPYRQEDPAQQRLSLVPFLLPGAGTVRPCGPRPTASRLGVLSGWSRDYPISKESCLSLPPSTRWRAPLAEQFLFSLGLCGRWKPCFPPSRELFSSRLSFLLSLREMETEYCVSFRVNSFG